MSSYYVALLMISSLKLPRCRHIYNYIGLSWNQNYSNCCSAGTGCVAVHSYPVVYLQSLASFSFRCKLSCIWHWVSMCSQAHSRIVNTKDCILIFIVCNLQSYAWIEACAWVPAIQGFGGVVMEIKYGELIWKFKPTFFQCD